MSEAAHAESRQTLRHAAALGAQRLLQVGMTLVFAAIVPRTMGPEIYGKFSTILSMSMWFTLMSGLGAVSMMTRFVPDFVERGDREGLNKFASNLLALRFLNGAAAAALYTALVGLWLKQVDLVAAEFLAASIAMRTLANLPFTLFLGRNQAARWGAGDLLRRTLLFPLVFVGYSAAGLRGACAGVFVTETLVLALGLWWARDSLAFRLLKIDFVFLRPFLRFGAAFFAGNVLLMLFHQAGPAFVRLLSGNYTEAGYYSIAFGAYLTGVQGVWKLLNAFGSLFSTLRARQDSVRLEAWISRLLVLLGVTTVLAAAFVYVSAGWLVHTVLGSGFAPVADLLPLLAVAALAIGPSSIARLLAVTFDEPRSSITASALQVGTFLAGGGAFIPTFGSKGACAIVVVSVTVSAAYSTWHMRRRLSYSLTGWLKTLLVGFIGSPLLWAPPFPGLWRFALFAGAFLTTLGILKVIRLDDIRTAARTAFTK